MKPLFIVLEGPDASGKSTQVRLLADALSARGIPILATREPGGTPLGERLRELVLSSDSPMNPLTELLLIIAARHEHVEQVVRPALKEGKWVLCSRYTLSSLAYQGWGRGLDLDLIRRLNQLATGGLEPDYVFLLDLPPTVAYERTRERDRFEGEGLEFFTRVRVGYLALIRSVPRAHVIDGTLPQERVLREILGHLPVPGI
ncbi:MAG TPA: dTMP kinase [Candidatus Acetothermia bacterium]|nr:dTMP kinase [Candidatus Acetothermia bacterium]